MTPAEEFKVDARPTWRRSARQRRQINEGARSHSPGTEQRWRGFEADRMARARKLIDSWFEVGIGDRRRRDIEIRRRRQRAG
jgi:hypothetical protein